MKIPIMAAIGVTIIAIIIVVAGSEGNYQIEEEVPEITVLKDDDIGKNSTDDPELQALMEMLESERQFDFEAHDLVRFFEGEDGKGATIVDILNARMYQNYPDLEAIVMNPHRVEWYNYVDEEKDENFVIVGYAFETFREKSEYIWEVNKIDNTITAKNDAAQELLDIVNSED